MKFVKLNIPDVIVIEPDILGDARGFFFETYKKNEFAANGINVHFVQDNMSSSTKNVLRGLHYQLDPMAQGKLVRVVVGEVFDVAVDIRKGSPWYGKWVGQKLSAKNGRSMYVPPGFAHGFCVLSNDAVFHYKCTNYYSRENERGLLWNDSEVGIEWPVSGNEVVLSEKDKNAVGLSDIETNFIYT
ncbi:MAG: dTDP-4-dehydrorhamnose 3,5-epimerase [Chlamydiae bacterium]|nr:MAG: dTDP-4-dehydrorhamnose 3,5-epimerase [Chlamydiota bacterium]